mmetsp:Transcript_30307/g.38887  ORF Transcript_30307/g.38887 Transcript_30307/m.38887 type:complete len:214 (-) Transcript_30307:74-715(-)
MEMFRSKVVAFYSGLNDESISDLQELLQKVNVIWRMALKMKQYEVAEHWFNFVERIEHLLKLWGPHDASAFVVAKEWFDQDGERIPEDDAKQIAKRVSQVEKLYTAKERKLCSKCNKGGHSPDECTVGQCFGCGSYGHMKRNCPKRKRFFNGPPAFGPPQFYGFSQQPPQQFAPMDASGFHQQNFSPQNFNPGRNARGRGRFGRGGGRNAGRF